MLYYFPLEHLEMRYTKNLDEQIVSYLDDSGIKYKKIYPLLSPPIEDRGIKNGSFLDAPSTIEFKCLQLAEISKLFYKDEIKDGDELFFSDIWFPGVESLSYLKYFCKKDIKLKGILHAGSFTDTDFVRDLERWAKGFEDIIFDIFDEIYVASEFIKNDLIKKRIIDKSKIKVTPFPLDFSILEQRSFLKDNIVIFNGRNVDEKQPWLFDELEKVAGEKLKKLGFLDVKFINTQKENLSKKEYHKLLGKSKVIVSFALQENFGFGVNEAVLAGCIPITPNRLVYPEFFPEEYLYSNFEECVNKVVGVFLNEFKQITYEFEEKCVNDKIMTLKTWF